MTDDDSRVMEPREVVEYLRGWVPESGWSRRVALDTEKPQVFLVVCHEREGVMLVEVGSVSRRDLRDRLAALPGVWREGRAEMTREGSRFVGKDVPPIRDSLSNN